MKQFNLLSILLMISISIIITGFSTPDDEKSKLETTGGELSFTVRTVSAGGNYAPSHVLAIWVEYDGDFVKTRKAMANQRKQYLYTWKASTQAAGSVYNVVDAITGSTLTSHQTHTVTWDCTDLDGNIVPDGEYVVLTEFTSQHAQGPVYELSFTKGPDAVSLTPADETYFKDIELEFTPYVSEFSGDVTEICQWGTVTFTDESVNATDWEWDFGEGAAPATSNTQGPHTVYYTTPGDKTVSLTINGSVTEQKDDYIDVTQLPTAQFTYSSSELTVNFTNQSTGATDYLWDFGDGNTSTEENPVHTYATGGAFSVSLNAILQDCEDNSTVVINVPVVGINESAEDRTFTILPNPNNGQFVIETENLINVVQVTIFDIAGKIIFTREEITSNNPTVPINLDGIRKGVYFVKISSDGNDLTKKLVIR